MIEERIKECIEKESNLSLTEFLSIGFTQEV